MSSAKKKPSAEDRHIATFEAYIPQIKSSMLFGADGCQLKLEIPGTELDAALALAKKGQAKVLHVSVFEAEDQPFQ